MLRIGLVGVGHLGKHHLRLLKAIDIVEFSGCYDISDVVRKNLRDQGHKVFPSYEALIDASDAVDIVVPTTDHFPLATQALDAGKHVFIEKPITETVDEAEQLVAQATDNKLTLQVGHIERFNPAIRSLQHITLAPRFIESHRLAQFQQRGTEVAVILDLMIHDIDIVLSLVQSPVQTVEASGVDVITGSIDIANARLTFENGCVANITASRISQKPMRKIRLFQPAAYISIDFFKGVTEIYRLHELGGSAGEDQMPVILGELEHEGKKKAIVYEQPDIQETNALQDELESFARCVQEKNAPVVSGADGLRALQVAQLIHDKVKQSTLEQ